MKPEKVIFPCSVPTQESRRWPAHASIPKSLHKARSNLSFVLSLVGDTPDYPIDATPGSDPWTGRIQATCLGASSESSKVLAEACMTACYKKNGLIGGAQVVAVLIATRGASHYDMDVDTYQQSVDFVVHYYR